MCDPVKHSTYKSWFQNLKGRDNSEELGVDEKIMLECILRKWSVKLWTGCIWLRIGASGRLL
jgi:hypothetical protein